jgi:hypothetical protein
VQARLLTSATLLALVAAAAPHAQQAAAPEPSQLPVRRVVLYKSGVGYFEHQGSVTGSVDVAIQFTSAQLNDVLKSLTALDLDKGQISSIGYNSVAPIEQRLQALRLPLGREPDIVQFYAALRGARVEVKAGAESLTGRLLNVERQLLTDDKPEWRDLLTVIAADGSVRTIPITRAVTIRIAEAQLREEVGRYLAVVASGRDQDVRRMILSASGSGTRRLMVSYVSEVPIWKSTYRVVLPQNHDEEAVMQGWAIVDNTVGEDWNSVELSLVAGAPQSFVQQISQPYYMRRPEVPFRQLPLLNPQLHQATLQSGGGKVRGIVRDGQGAVLPGVTVTLSDQFGRPVARAVTGSSGNYEIDAAAGPYRLTMSLEGFTTTNRETVIGPGAALNVDATMAIGPLAETITVQASAPGASLRQASGGNVAPAPVQRVDQFAQMGTLVPIASGQELGDLFEYRISQPVTIRTNQSALVPILNARVAAERVSLWNRAPGNGRPLRAVWLTNKTGSTLDGGTFSVIADNAFAGEGLIDSLRPEEKRLVSFGSDLGVLVDARLDNTTGRYTRVTARNGVLIAEEENRQRWVYRIRNEDAAARSVVVEHQVRPGWTLTADSVPVETTASAARYKLSVGARDEATLHISERQIGETRYGIGQVDDRLVATFGQRGVPPDEMRRVLQPLFDARTQLAASDGRLASLTSQVTSIAGDQQRVRENIKALGSSREQRSLIERYTRELNAQEDQLARLRADIAATTAQRDALRASIAELVQTLTFEVTVK